jgi:hypothetical protein
MTPEQKLRIDYSRLIGEFTGTLKGLLWYELPEDIKAKLRDKIKQLEEIDIDK